MGVLKKRSGFKGRSIVSINDLSRSDILAILNASNKIELMPGSKRCKLMHGKVLATLFFEPSTRTRLSFESAMSKLGGRVIGFSDTKATSVSKGESLHDTILIVANYADIIAMRHPVEGSARLASELSSVPVINGGDGANQHPTQTLLDLYSIKKAHGKISNLNIAMVGDLKYGRTVHSLAIALSHFNCRLYFVAPDMLQMPEEIINLLKERNIRFSFHKDIDEIISKSDIIYMTRIQKERFGDPEEYEKVKGIYVLTPEILKDARRNMKIMHPLPRVDEISQDVDKTKHAYYFQQAKNGVVVRQAIIALLTGVL